MTQNIPAANPSPRIVRDVLYWYCGDTFDLDIEITLTADDGIVIPLQDGDKVSIRFYSEYEENIYTFSITEFEGNTVTVHMTEEISKKFRRGQYRYDVVHTRDYRRTIAHRNSAVVE